MKSSIRELVPEYIRSLAQYVPGRPIEEVERELGMIAIKLASNENPLGPSPRAVEAVRRAIVDSNRYPDGSGQYVREALAARWELPVENFLLGAGSTELIDLVARALLDHGDEGLTSEGSFPLYYTAIQAAGAKVVKTRLKDYAFDFEALTRAVTPRTKVIYLANPNNPTGTMFTGDVFAQFLDRVREDVVVVLDEAYYEYVQHPGYPRSIELLKRKPNLMVLRTFSKAHGLAGLRIGYGMGPAELIEEINKFRSPFNTSNVAQAAALAALEDVGHVKRSVANNQAGLDQLKRGFQELDIQFVPSFGNFVFVELGEHARRICHDLLHRGVITRPMGWMGFPNAIRVSVGRPKENEMCLRELAELLKGAEHYAPLPKQVVR